MMIIQHQSNLIRFIITLCMWQEIACGGRGNNHGSRFMHHQQRSTIDVKEKIIEWQCYAKCGKDPYCLEPCKADTVKSNKRGSCAIMQNAIFQNFPPLQKLSCLDNCRYDFDCPDVQKCCDSVCGPACVDAIGVRDDIELPPIPKILKYKLSGGHKVEIIIQSSANSMYSIIHVEVRYHIGLLFSKRKLGMWNWQPVEKIAEISDLRTKRTDISFNIRPGRWYQVRVAAINGYGFRGYSEPSEPFKLKNNPKPPKPPVEVKIISNNFDGNNCAIKIVWCPSKSNLPVEKYKIMWSLYTTLKDELHISNEAYVKDAHEFIIKKLLPDNSYYIQLVAMAINGRQRLKSEKFSLLYNTTKLSTPSSNVHLHCAQQDYIEIATTTNHSGTAYELPVKNHNITVADNTSTTYDVRFRLNRKFGMIVQISGFHPHKEKIYELCPKDTNCAQRDYRAIRAKKTSLEFSKLQYNTTYVLKAFRTNLDTSTPTGSFTFTTPKCENFRKRFPKMQIKC